MQKSQSCDRCIRTGRVNATTHDSQQKTIKKPEAQLAKKFEQLYDEDRKWKDKRKAQAQKIIRQQQDKEIQGCTFKPEILHNPEYHVDGSSFLKREQNWKKNIDKKIAQKREQQSNKEKQYSFKPKISNYPLTCSQLRQKSTNYSYLTKTCYVEKKSYKELHSERKKLKELTKSIVVEPFKHRVNTLESSRKLDQSIITQSRIKKEDAAIRIENQQDNQQDIHHTNSRDEASQHDEEDVGQLKDNKQDEELHNEQEQEEQQQKIETKEEHIEKEVEAETMNENVHDGNDVEIQTF